MMIIVITIMGDGFTADQQDNFINAATKVVNFMIGNPNTGKKVFIHLIFLGIILQYML